VTEITLIQKWSRTRSRTIFSQLC